MLTRERIRDGEVLRIIAGRDPTLEIASPEAMAAERAALLATVDLSRGVWVFAYGSLMWNPAFHHVERQVARIHGYHRRFCIWSHAGRGSADAPGLLLALEHGGSCRGILYRIAPAAIDHELDILWQREMIGGVYRARWVTARWGTQAVPAITFTVKRDHHRYAGRVAPVQAAAAIASAEGPLGTSADYLSQTVSHLEALGICESPLRALRDRVARIRGEN